MSATAAPSGASAARLSFWQRLKAFCKRTAAKVRSFFSAAGRKTASGARRGASRAWFHLTRFGRWSWRMAKKGATYARRGVGYGGNLVTGGIYILASMVAGGVCFLTLGVLSGAILGVIAIFDGLRVLLNLFNTWVVGYFAWLASRERYSFREWRLMDKLDREERRRAWHEKVLHAVESIADPEPEAETEYVEPSMAPDALADFEPIVVPQPAPQTTADRKVITTLEEKAALRVQADLDDEDIAFPGARVVQAATEDPYVAEESRYEPNNPVLTVMGRWLGKNEDKTAVDFRFEGEWAADDQAEALEVLYRTAGGKEEISYWLGRKEALDAYRHRETLLEESGRGWALVHARYRNNQSYSLKFMRAGFMDEVADLKVQRDKADRREREQLAAQNGTRS